MFFIGFPIDSNGIFQKKLVVQAYFIHTNTPNCFCLKIGSIFNKLDLFLSPCLHLKVLVIQNFSNGPFGNSQFAFVESSYMEFISM